MRVLVACEFSGVVRDAFIRAGNDAVSCDLLPSESPGPHIQADVREVLNDGWDLMIAHPPCTLLATCGARSWPGREAEQEEALDFFRELLAAPIERICVENPISIAATRIRPPNQVIQPWQYGHGEMKTTCLWLKQLWRLRPTKIVEGRTQRANDRGPHQTRWKRRSKTYPGIAAAMAEQWHENAGRPSRY